MLCEVEKNKLPKKAAFSISISWEMTSMLPGAGITSGLDRQWNWAGFAVVPDSCSAVAAPVMGLLPSLSQVLLLYLLFFPGCVNTNL